MKTLICLLPLVLLVGCATPKPAVRPEPLTKYEQALQRSRTPYEVFRVTGGNQEYRILKVGTLYINPATRKSNTDWKAWGRKIEPWK